MVCKCKKVIIESCSKAGKCKINCSKCNHKGTGILKIKQDLLLILSISYLLNLLKYIKIN